MDVRQYYRKVNEAERGLEGPYLLMVSLETTDGGKAGMISEVTREVAAKLIVEGRAVPATCEEQELYRVQQAAAKKKVQASEMARRIQVAIVSEPDLHASGTSNSPLSSGK